MHECKDANIVVNNSWIKSKTRTNKIRFSFNANAKIMKEITESVVASGFKGIFLIASNPVDLMTT